MSKFALEIITSIGLTDLGEVEYLRAPGLDGLFGVMKNHAPAMISMDVGVLKIVQNGKESLWATSGGIADIRKDKVQLLLETAEKSDAIDIERAKKSAERAKQRLADQRADAARAKASLSRAINRVKLGGI
ncbi:MAG: ATP synthase F1 subunit epsilon [Candidatus Marinimicrobia bacterium]|nr:ATP synthase F1 subunit epsilon [Candidatus Neomarinimicrobiota bacterium]